jgi:hypothetical protein
MINLDDALSVKISQMEEQIRDTFRQSEQEILGTWIASNKRMANLKMFRTKKIDDQTEHDKRSRIIHNNTDTPVKQIKDCKTSYSNRLDWSGNEVEWLETGCSRSLMYINYDWHNCSAADHHLQTFHTPTSPIPP